ncbi:FecR family protein [uncultured Polaribacter sp.]|uniref:FecR family protein n=1 Tax=uncultured Polaribacter sp. TaxID=174711 RepID=UPI002632589E|nr:FecR family protein [uncultured Polaribacter sp.]
MEFILIIKKINNTLSEKESLEFDQWYSESKEHQKYFNNVKNNKDSKTYIFDSKKHWGAIEKSTKNKIKPLWKFYGAVATIALLLSIANLSGLFEQKNITPEIFGNKTIESKTILTLSNGKEVVLSTDKVFENSNIKSNGKHLAYTYTEENDSIHKEIEYNYLTTKRGCEFSLILSDGTKVWLNSESKIKYPVAFIKGKPREVELIYGEAYFEVSPSTKNNGAGFKVINDFQKISVLGTHFNVKAYQEDNVITTTLLEGKVLLKNTRNEKIYLSPNQQVVLSKSTSKIKLQDVEAQETIAWIRGYFNFNDITLNEITKVLSRWYDVDFLIEDKEVKELKFNGVLSKKEELGFILKAISNTSNLTYEKHNKKIKIKR